jgi:hypothetical protein
MRVEANVVHVSSSAGRILLECSNDQKSDLFWEVNWEAEVPGEPGTSVEVYRKCTEE